MEELLVAITRGLVDQPDAVTVEVDQPDEEGVIVHRHRPFFSVYKSFDSALYSMV